MVPSPLLTPDTESVLSGVSISGYTGFIYTTSSFIDPFSTNNLYTIPVALSFI